MINIRMRVSTTEGPQGEFAISPKVQVEFERQYKTGIGKAFENDLKMEHIYWLGWKAMHYAGRVVKPFDSWLDEIVEIEVVNESTGPLDETV